MKTDTFIIADAGGNPVWCPLEPVYAKALGIVPARQVKHPGPADAPQAAPRPRYAAMTHAERCALRN